MASEDEFDPATALAALESLQPETSGALDAIEMLSDTSDLLRLASTLFPGIPAMGGTLGTVVSVIGCRPRYSGSSTSTPRYKGAMTSIPTRPRIRRMWTR
jgi:hypothetical protein